MTPEPEQHNAAARSKKNKTQYAAFGAAHCVF